MRGHVRHLADSGGDSDQPQGDVHLSPGPGPGGETQPGLTPPPSVRPGKVRSELSQDYPLTDTPSDRSG